MTWIAVAAGGALGSVLRFALSRAALPWQAAASTHLFPWPTLLANLLGCLLMGLLWGWQSGLPLSWSPALRGAVFSGLLGGFTTFSAFSLETLQLQRGGDTALAFAYLAASVLFGLGLAWIGLQVGERLGS